MTDLNEKALKPCPFCGEAMMLRGALWPSEGDRDSVIHAEATDCPLPQFSNDTFDERIFEVWSRRAEDAERLAGARVKVLEWSTNWGTIKAETPIGHYFIEARRDGSFDCRLENVWKTWASSSDAAKAAAQADFERRILSALAEPAGEVEPWGWVIPKRGKRKPVILEADKFDEVSAAAEAEIDDLGYFPVYTTPPDASAIRGAGDLDDDVSELFVDAWAEADKAMRKFPQPNYVISKVAEEAGEVVKAAIHFAEGRDTAEHVAAEIKQAIAMLIRLYIEGDQVHGLPPIRATLVGAKP